MLTDLNSFTQLVQDTFPEAVTSPEGIISVPAGSLTVHIASLPGDPDNLIFRVLVLKMSDVRERGAFAKAALAGNFFWSGTWGATLSLGADDGLYLTERRPLEEFVDQKTLTDCIDNLIRAVSDWQTRSDLYA